MDIKPVDTTDPSAVGVLIARFQVPELHEAHRKIVEYVCGRHAKVLILLGRSPLPGTKNNPLDFEARKQMILEAFPSVTVLSLPDNRCNIEWSRLVDMSIMDLTGPHQGAVLYGGRDSFIPYYKGRYKTVELESGVDLSGTEMRKKAAAAARPSADFRAGAVWAAHQRYDTVVSTVDVAIWDADNKRVLLGRKRGEKEFRFIGGFCSPSSTSNEEDARREVLEETGVEMGSLTYLSSHNIDDWRFRGEADKIRTTFFLGRYMYGAPIAADDIHEVRWFGYSELKPELFVPEHRVLFMALFGALQSLLKEKKR